MKNKKHIGQLISIKFTDRKNPIYGIVVNYNENWTLMKYNPIDYIIDGYIIIKHKNIDGFKRDTEEKWKEKIIKLKELQTTDKDIIPLTNLETILEYINSHFGIIQIYTKSENSCYIGRLISIDSKEVIMDLIDTKAKWCGKKKFKATDIRLIEFETDYINSLKLVLKNKKIAVGNN